MDIADPLLAAAHELRLRCFMGPLPFDVDAWLAQRHECDLPASFGGPYHFEARTLGYIGTFFKLQVGPQGPELAVGVGSGPGRFPATYEGFREAVSELNTFAEGPIGPQKYIWLHGSSGIKFARDADAKHQARLNQAMINLARRDRSNP